MLDVDAYLARLAYDGPRTPTIETLCGLHEAHLLAVPFENLDIHRGRPIVLDEAALFDKIVRLRRGGFCYEVNGLFAALLRALGFSVTLLSARDVRADGTYGPEFDHLALLVTLDERWLADVGWGDTFVRPLQLDNPDEQFDGRRAYRIITNEVQRMLKQQGDDGSWEDQYVLTLQARAFSDYAEMCRYHQTSPESSFTQRRLCTRATAEGRVTLSDRRLIIADRSRRREETLRDDREWTEALWKHFGMRLD